MISADLDEYLWNKQVIFWNFLLLLLSRWIYFTKESVWLLQTVNLSKKVARDYYQKVIIIQDSGVGPKIWIRILKLNCCTEMLFQSILNIYVLARLHTVKFLSTFARLCDTLERSWIWILKSQEILWNFWKCKCK